MEKLYRGSTWRIFDNNEGWTQLDSRTVVFPLRVAADKEGTVRYKVEYTRK